MDKFLITEKGYKRLKKELDILKNIERPAIITAIAEAKALGDLSENAEYHSAREKQGMLEANIRNLEDKVARSEIVFVSQIEGGKIRFGATVVIEDNDTEKRVTYQIVSDYESDIDSGLLSVKSPMARALIGREEGDEVEVQTPGGLRSYEIIDVKFI